MHMESTVRTELNFILIFFIIIIQIADLFEQCENKVQLNTQGTSQVL